MIMSSYFCASIRIGGSIKRSKVERLLSAIGQAGVSLEWGDAPFAPQTADKLMEAKQETWLWLCDERASCGEFPELEAACRKLKLGYLRHSEASFDCDAERADWRQGMKKPIVRPSSNVNSHDTYVSTEAVCKALELFEAGNAKQAIRSLRRLCPDIPKLPPFEIV